MNARNLTILGAVAFGAFALFRLADLWLAAPGLLVTRTPDDAYYYYQIARNLAAGAGSTFDGLNATNGYHPLYLLLAWGGALAGGWTPEAGDTSLLFPRLMMTLSLLLGCGGIALLAREASLAARTPAAAAILLAAACNPFVIYALTDGLESGLVLASLGLVAWGMRRFGVFTREPHPVIAGVGLLLGIAFLARLDLAFLAVGLALALLVRALAMFRRYTVAETLTDLILRGFLLFTPLVVVFLLYLGVNSLLFDTMTPISGQMKSDYAAPAFYGEWLRAYPIPIGAGLAAVLLLPLLWRGLATARDTKWFLAGGACFILIHLAHTLVYTHWGVHAWHFTGYWAFALVVVAIASVRAIEAALPSNGARAAAVAAAIALFAAAGAAGQWKFLAGRAERSFQGQAYAAALWARDHIPADRRIGLVDAGTFAYARGGGVVNLDGVVNNLDYQMALADRQFADYLGAMGVLYLGHHAWRTEETEPGYGTLEYSAVSYLHRRSGGSVRLREEDEVYRGPDYPNGDVPSRFLLHAMPAIAVEERDETMEFGTTGGPTGFF